MPGPQRRLEFAEPPRYVDGLPRPGRALVMGVLNVTPDSFSDGGRYLDPAAAVEHGRRLVAQGADLVDVGGESTRPGAVRPGWPRSSTGCCRWSAALVGEGVLVSVDTMRAEVAAAAVESGAVLVNDVSGGLADEAMLSTVAASAWPTSLMHWRAHAEDMQRHTGYDDVVTDVSPSSATAAGAAARPASTRPGRGRPGHRLRQDRRPELGRAGRPGAAARPRPPGAGRAPAASGSWARCSPTRRAGRGPPRSARTPRRPRRRSPPSAGAWCVRVHDVRRHRSTRCGWRTAGPRSGSRAD